MMCAAILRKSPQAGKQCRNTARNGAWCLIHDPVIVLPRLRAKRERIVNSLLIVDAAIEAADRLQEPEGNPS